jgi:RHS repeat-associated protein
MRRTFEGVGAPLAVAVLIAVGARATGVGALDHVPNLYGSQGMAELTLTVLNQCAALHQLGDPVAQRAGGSTSGETALQQLGAGGTQLVAPMSRRLGSGICSVEPASRAGAEGMVIALDAVSVVVNSSTAGSEGIDYAGSPGDVSNQWRTVLRQIYAGMDDAAASNVFARDCNSLARKAIVNNWDNVFHGTATSCADSHPSVLGTGANGYDQTNSIVEPGVRHAFRRADDAGMTDIFLAQLGLAGIDFAQPAPAGATATQAAAYRGLAGSPFCNNKRPEDKWAPTTLPANATLGYNASQIPEMTNVGVPASVGTGLGYSTLARSSTNPRNLAPYSTEYMDQDPIRRTCVGRGSNANANLPMEQVCGADGTLGVVLPIVVPSDLAAAQLYPSLPCEPGIGFHFGPALTRPTSIPVRCPNGDASQDSQCLLPVRTDPTRADGFAFDCINPPGNRPAIVFDNDGDGSTFTDAPLTDGRTDVDGRVYNLILRNPDGSILQATRPDSLRPGLVTVPIAASYYRIHSTRSLLLPPNHAANVCAGNTDSNDQIGCLTLASPCSIGYAGRRAVTNNPGTSGALVNGIANTPATVRALALSGTSYPLASKLYLNTLRGFELLHNSDSSVPGTDAEEELAKCFATLPFDGTINVESPAFGLTKLPALNGSTTEKPLCEDFNGQTLCGDATNSDACIGNETISGGKIPGSPEQCPGGPVDDGNPCTADLCNGAQAVTHTPLNGTACDDNSVCNGHESCVSGVCASGVAPTINDGNPCTADSCDATFGAVHSSLTGTYCDDANLCNGRELCAGGVCGAGTALNVDDGDPCTVDACEPATGIVSHSATVADDRNPCTADSCNSSNGQVAHVTLADGAACAGNLCRNDVCLAGTCVAGGPLTIEDGIACTLDTCSAMQGVRHHECSSLDRTVSTELVDAASFLYSESNPLQPGVALGAMTPSRIAVLRGRVFNSNATPISGVLVTVVGHPEFGSTFTQGSGAYDLAVNGGQQLRLRFELTPYLSIERTVIAPVQDYVTVSDVSLSSLDTEVTLLDLSGNATDVQVARSTSVSDVAGTRRTTLFVPAGTVAAMALPDGSMQSLSQIHFRATEYTVGSQAPNALPATVPSGIATPYAVDLSADEGRAAGASRIEFSQSLSLYVENFLGLKVGTAIPHGAYDSALGAWVPVQNGVVLKILSISGGLANVDADGDTNADGSAALATLGITDSERAHLAQLYTVGRTLWRTPVLHFSSHGSGYPTGPAGGATPECKPNNKCQTSDGVEVPCTVPILNKQVCPDPNHTCDVTWLYTHNDNYCCPAEYGGDCWFNGNNAGIWSGLGGEEGDKRTWRFCLPLHYGVNYPVGTIGIWLGYTGQTTCDYPPPPTPPTGDGPDPCKEEHASTIQCQRQSLGEDVQIAGTPFSLHYESDRQRGRAAELTVPLKTTRPAFGALGIDLKISIAGRTFTQSFPSNTNPTTTFLWDGTDAYGRLLQGAQPATAEILYHFTGAYQGADAFGGYGSGVSTTIFSAQDFTVSKSWHGTVGTWDALPEGLGGWAIAQHHVYDVTGRVLRLGDGSNRTLTDIPATIQTIAGTGESGVASGDGASATAAVLPSPTAVALGPDGAIYVSDGGSCVRKIGRDGVIHSFAGQCQNPGFSGDDGLAIASQLQGPSDIAFGPDGSLYIADTVNQRIRVVSPSGVIGTFAGSGVASFGGDGGPALAASFSAPSGVDIAPDGTVYIADSGNGRVRSVAPDRIVRTVAGTGGTTASTGDEGPARAASLTGPRRVRVAPDGSLYIAESNLPIVRRVGTDGIIHAFAGNTNPGPPGDGTPASMTPLQSPLDIAVRPDGTVLILAQDSTIRAVSAAGSITRLAGVAGQTGHSGDNGLAAAATFSAARGIRVAPDDSVYLACTNDNRIRRISGALPGFSDGTNLFRFPTADGKRLDVFNGRGRHLATLDTLTGTELIRFGYDSAGHLNSLTDVDGNISQVTHDSGGNPSSIVAPFGQRTMLGVDGNGYLASVTDPQNQVTHFTYDQRGLMLTKVDAKLGLSQYGYDANGRLQSDKDPFGGSKTISRTDTQTGFTVKSTSALGQVSSFQTSSTIDGNFSRQNQRPDGLTSSMSFSKQGVSTYTAPDGTRTTTTQIPDPRFGMLAPTVATTTTLPSNVSLTQSVSRSIVQTNGQLTSLIETTQLNGNPWTRMFDSATRTWTAKSPLGRGSLTVVDGAGRPTEVTTFGIATRRTNLDPFGRVSALGQGLRNQGFTYFGTSGPDNGYLQTATNALAQTTTFTRDAFGRPLTVIAPDVTITGFAWDALGNLTSVTPPGKPAHGLSYNAVNLFSQYTPPALASVPSPQTVYEYDSDRKLKKETRPDGSIVSYAYNNYGLLQTVSAPSGTVGYTYNSVNQVGAINNSSDGVSLNYSYDGQMLTLSSWGGQVSGTVTSSYNNDFRLSREQVAAVGFPSTGAGSSDGYYSYDADGLINCASPSSCTTIGSDVFSLNHDVSSGLLTSNVLRNITDSLTYNTFGELASETALNGSAPLFAESYDSAGAPRDALGRVTRRTETLQGSSTSFEYEYDPRGRLATVKQGGTQTASYAYDSNGNRISVTTASGTTSGSYDAQDRLLSYGAYTYTHGANGELATKTNTVTGGVTAYQYDVFGNLKRVDLPNGDVIQYLVDGQNRRIAKKKNGVFQRKWLYRDQLHPVAELDASGNLLKRFYFASGRNSPDFMIQAGVEYRILSDRFGSPRLVVEAGTGAVVQRMRHDEFGIVLEDTNPGFIPFGFAGGLYDPDTGLVRFGARDYDPAVGKWTSRDPILFDGGSSNLRAYAGNDPVNHADPLGLTTYRCRKPLDAIGGTDDPENQRNGPDVTGNPLFHEYLCVTQGQHVVCGGQTEANGHAYGPGAPSNDPPSPTRCEEVSGDDTCLESCIASAILSPTRPRYGIVGPGTNCQEWAEKQLENCYKACPPRY